jgi:hypothetical protein
MDRQPVATSEACVMRFRKIEDLKKRPVCLALIKNISKHSHMFMRLIRFGVVLLWAVCNAGAAYVIGEGPDASFLVIEAQEFGSPLVYEYRYTVGFNAPLDSYALISAIAAADPLLEFTAFNYGSEAAPNIFLTSITYSSILLENTGAPEFEPYWGQWVSGGRGGYPNQNAYPEGEWTFGSGLSAPYRTLASGSWDGVIYNDGFDPPSVEPIPEPATFFLLALGATVLILIRTRARAN